MKQNATTRAVKKPKLFQQMMDEHIHLPGCPGVIVTRGYAYQWLKDIGYDENAKGFGSIDYAVFSQRPVSESLSDLNYYKNFLEDVKKHLQR